MPHLHTVVTAALCVLGCSTRIEGEESLYPITVRGKIGFITARGDIVITPQLN
jgi:hypothetical protein